jgi:signal transduction histidine kinase
MTYLAFFVLGLALGAAAGWFLGSRRGLWKSRQQLASLADGLRAGNLPDPTRTGSSELSEVKELREILSKDWVHRSPETEDEVRRALLRLALYLRRRVEAPLLSGLEAGGKILREGADEALGAVEDLEFFLEDPPIPGEPAPRNLAEVVQQVTRDFASQSNVLVKVRSPREPIRVRIEAEPFKDALFLILHNAGEFGGGEPVQVTLDVEGGKARVRVEDRGPGFTAEGLLKAMDPFYSTSPDGLGLGLPHARKSINAQGGEVFLRNAEKGGAEVEVRLPLVG